MVSLGVVREFHPDDGWGVIDGDDVPGGCWVPFAVIRMGGYRELTPSEHVRFTFEHVRDQDGYAYRATAAWPLTDGDGDVANRSSSSAYGSSLHLVYDDSPESDGESHNPET